jgi:hypothetical protein
MNVLFEYMEDFNDEDYWLWKQQNNLTQKRCITCKILKNLSNFPSDTNNKDGLHNKCKDCKKIEKSGRDKLRPLAPPKPDYCECCGREPTKDNSINLDHDHKTLEIRGWICATCNTSIGKLGDTIESLERVLNYLKKDKTEYNRRNPYFKKE